MKFDLNELKSYQKTLDEAILNKHSLKVEDTIMDRKLALLVELGEFANETRCFKYWSLKESSAKDVLLEEYVDGIHFIVSLANQFDIDLVADFNQVDLTLNELLLNAYKAISLIEVDNQVHLADLLKWYYAIAFKLGFSQADIIDAYMQKNQINFVRQESDY
jgi:dimeric dUTPase (all-alpha-NTP-PPase superfamily)